MVNKIIKFFKKIFFGVDKEKYIEFNNRNNQWNNGYIYVYVNDIMVEFISVDDYLENNTNENIYCSDDIIDLLKEKYNITKVIKDEGYNWR